ncbi:minor capsid protein [Mediterraneibacter agrestimuris]|uniref:minor capsid protein n=1 Tax=Mediterraneibacter agrestimuris TaxID=2941333 RepID=UPI00203EB4CD|nr:minor capsid protein [Mediterraneibacter agrestimuris]
MGTRIRLEMDSTDKILLKRSLNENGKGQRFFTNEVRRLSDPYVPKRTGVLKNTASATEKKIVYNTPYARRQYYEHKGKGKRGPHWTERMWADRGKEIVRSVAAFCGGKAK